MAELVDDRQFDRAAGQQAQRPVGMAARRVHAGQGDEARFLAAVEFRRRLLEAALAMQGDREARRGEHGADAGDGAAIDADRRRHRRVGLLGTRSPIIGLEQDAGAALFERGRGVAPQQRFEFAALLWGETNDVLLGAHGGAPPGLRPDSSPPPYPAPTNPAISP